MGVLHQALSQGALKIHRFKGFVSTDYARFVICVLVTMVVRPELIWALAVSGGVVWFRSLGVHGLRQPGPKTCRHGIPWSSHTRCP